MTDSGYVDCFSLGPPYSGLSVDYGLRHVVFMTHLNNEFEYVFGVVQGLLLDVLVG